MGNKEFERSKTDKKTNDNHKIFAKRLFAKIAICAVIAGLIFTIVGCVNDQDTTENTNPGVTTPVDPSNPVEDSDDTVIDSDDPVVVPDDPIIDPDDPVIDPDDPVIDPDPENPGEDIPPEDVPPEDVPPEDKPPEEENPGQEDPSTEIPGSIDEVDEVDEINYFADEFTQILNDNYMDELARRLVNRYADANSIEKAEWLITNNNDTQIKELQAKVYFNDNGTRYFKVGKVSFNQAYSVQDIINGNATDLTYSVAYQNSSVTIDNIEANLDLGKTVIQTIDADNTLEGDIWCSYSFGWPGHDDDGYWNYHPITVYQITEKGVEKFNMTVKTRQHDHEWGVDVLINQIENGLYSSKTQSTEYTFTGTKIEQASA